MRERFAFVKVKALAAELIWDRESIVVSMLDQGVTEAGKSLSVQSDGLIDVHGITST